MSRLYLDELIDVRIFIFNGSKLIFCSRDAKSFYEEWKNKLGKMLITSPYLKEAVFDLTDTSKVVLLDLVPINVSVTHSINKFSTASVVFSNNRRRFYRRGSGKDTKWSTWKTNNLFNDDKDMLEAQKILKTYLTELETSDYYKSLYHYFNDKCRDKEIDEFSRPFKVVDYGYLIFIDALDRDGVWRAIFTGYITSVVETYVSAQDIRLTINCISLSNYLNKIPIFPDLGSGYMIEFVLPSDPKERAFLLAYYSQYRETGDYWKSVYIGKSLKELIELIIKTMRLRMGIVTENELRSSLLKVAGIRRLSESEIERVIEVYKEYLKDNYAFVFPFFKADTIDDIKVYTGISNIRKDFYLSATGIARIYIPAEFDFKEDGEGYRVYEKVYKERIDELINKLAQPDDIFEVFQRLIGLAISQSRFHPAEKKLSEILSAIIKQFGLVYFEDGLGNLIIDFPRYNEIPCSEYAFYEDMRGNEGKRYIIKEDEGILNSTITKDGERLLTAFFLHARLNIPNFTPSDLLTESLSAGHAWHTPWHLLRFGYNVETVNDVYYNFQLQATDLEKLKSIFNEYAKAYLEMRNAFVTKKLRLSLRHRPDLLVGRNVYIPSIEKLFYISSVSHTITLGSDFTTTLDLVAGHDIDLMLKEPRIYLIRDFPKLKETITAMDTQLEGSFGAMCNIVRVDRKYFPADLKPGVLTTSLPFESESIDIVRRDGYFENVPEVVTSILEEKGIEYIDIDIRLLRFIDWFYVYFTNLFNDKIVLDAQGVFCDKPDLLVFPYVTDLWRKKGQSEFSQKSRHLSGRAIDIAGLTFIILTKEGLKKLIKKMSVLSNLVCRRFKVIQVFKSRRSDGSVIEEPIYKYENIGVWDLVDEVKYEGYINSLEGLIKFFLYPNIRKVVLDKLWTEKKYQQYYDLKLLGEIVNKFLLTKDSVRIDKTYSDLYVRIFEEVMPPYPYEAASLFAIKMGFNKEYVDVMPEQFLPPQYKEKTIKLAPEGSVAVYVFHFLGIPETEEKSGEVVKFRNRVSDILVAHILANNTYFCETKIGYVVDATGGIRDRLSEYFDEYQKSEVSSPYVNTIGILLNEIEKIAKTEAGAEDDKRANYLIWKGGERCDYDCIVNNWDKVKDKYPDIYHLYHVHFSVGIVDCKEIQVLRRYYGLK